MAFDPFPTVTPEVNAPFDPFGGTTPQDESIGQPKREHQEQVDADALNNVKSFDPFAGTQHETFDPFPASQQTPQENTPVAPPQTHKKGVLDFGSNVGKDAWETLKGTIGGLVMAVPHGMQNLYNLPKEIARTQEARKIYGEGAAPTYQDFGKAYLDSASKMGDGMVNTWGKFYKPEDWGPDPDRPGRIKRIDGSIPDMVKEKLYHEPVSAALDVTTAIDLAGGVVGGLGKVTGVAKLESLGDTIRAAPAALVKKGWDKVKSMAGQDVAAKDLISSINDEEMASVKPKANADANQVLASFRGLSSEDRQLAHEIGVHGLSTGEALALKDINPQVIEAANAYRDYVQNVREAGLKDFNLPGFNDEVIQGRLAKQYAKSRYGMTDLTPGEIDDIQQEMKGLHRQPVYVPSKEELMSGTSLEDAMFQKDSLARKVGFLEKYTKGRISENPMEYIPRVTNSFRDTEGNLRFIDRVLQEPSLVRAGETGEASSIAEKIPTEGILKKYLDTEQQAKGVWLNELSQGLIKKGMAPAAAEIEATRLSMEDASTQKQMQAIGEIIPKSSTVSSYLKWKYWRPGGVLKSILDTYDNINALVKMGATRLNPRYYPGVATGQALMSMLSGTLPKWGSRARELEEFLPPQAQHVAIEGGLGQKILNATDVHGEMQAATKAGMITRFAARQISRASDLGFSTSAKINEVLPEVLQSTRNLGDFQVARQQLHEQIIAKVNAMMGLDEQVGNLPGRNTRQLAKLQAERNLMVGDLETKAINAGALSEQIPEFQKYAGLLRPAILEANTYLASTTAMSPAENQLWKRIIPYYNFQKTVTALAFRLPFVAPTSAFVWSRLSAELARQTTDPNLPPEMHGYYPMYLRENGDTVWVNLQGMSHAGGMGLSTFGGVPVPNMLNPVRANHFVALVYHLAGGRDPGARVVPFGTDEMFVNAHNGEVLKLDAEGKPVMMIPQLPLIKGVAHLFPWTQYAEHVLEPYGQTTEGWLLNPDAVKKPDGTYKYPYEMIQTLGEMLGPKVKIANRDQLIAQKSLHQVGILRTIEKEIPKADPDQREMLIQGLKDYVHGLGK